MATLRELQMGITGPLSSAGPTPAETQQTEALVEELKRQNNYESPAETAQRTVVLESLQKITEEFVKQVSRAQGKSESVVNQSGGKVFTYGSYRLGVFGPGSDIDTMVVVPKHISREDYFERFPDLLLKMAPPGSIDDLTSVPDAFVPIIKFVYSGISIDLIFSRLEQSQVPVNQTLTDDNVLRGLDESAVRSLNGPRVTDEILQLVPQKGTFKTALRGIKLWAQRRAIYANIIGFPGGVAWAMMVARICQLYPKAAASTLILKFFKIMDNWQWPQPVLLKHPQQRGPTPDIRVWNPKLYFGDQKHLMPVITPAYPSMCSTHNITYSTKAIIMNEIKRAGVITEQIFAGKASWKDLFVKQTFFTKDYKYYLSIISASTTKEEQKKWCGRVESRVRHLVSSAEEHDSIHIAHPFNKGFRRVHKCKTEEDVQKVKAGSLEYLFKEVPTETTDLAHDSVVCGVVKEETSTEDKKLEENEKCTMVYTDTFYIGLELEADAKSLDIAAAVNNFKTNCINWEKYNAEFNALNVCTTRNFDLPEDVFTEGEVKPVRAKKKIIKKRAAPDDSGAAPAKRQQTSLTAAG